MTPILSPSDFEEKSIRINLEYADYLRDKTVAIVSRGVSEDFEQGELIDSHDVVVRVHNTYPYTRQYPTGRIPIVAGRQLTAVPDEWHSRIGSKCDIMFFKYIIDKIDTHSTDSRCNWSITDECTSFILHCIKHEAETFYENGGKFLCAEN